MQNLHNNMQKVITFIHLLRSKNSDHNLIRSQFNQQDGFPVSKCPH